MKRKQLYFVLIILLMIISLYFSIDFPITAFWLPHWIIIGIILSLLIFGMIRLTNRLSKIILVLSSIHYLMVSIMALNGKIETMWILLPLTLIPILTSKLLEHTGIGNRIALAFWLVLGTFMGSTMYPLAKNIFTTVIVAISYYLQIVTIFYSTSESYVITEMAWMNVKDRNPNVDYYNANHFDRKL